MKKKQYPKYFTVSDLKMLLNSVPNNLPIGVVGHYGEFFKMDKHNFKLSSARLIPVDKRTGFEKKLEDADDHKSPIFEIHTPNIGEEPD